MRVLETAVLCVAVSVSGLTGAWHIADAAQYTVSPQLPPEYKLRSNSGAVVFVSERFEARSLQDWTLNSRVHVSVLGKVAALFESPQRTKDDPVAISDSFHLAGNRGFYGVTSSAGGEITPVLLAQHAFVFRAGEFKDLHPLLEAAFSTPSNPVKNSIAYDVNATGDVVGVASADDHTSFGFLYKDGAVVKLDSTNNIDTRPVRVNNFGQVTGSAYFISQTPNGTAQESRGFVYSRGVFRKLGVLPDFKDVNNPSSLNDAGQIVGVLINTGRPPRTHGFVHEGGTVRGLGTLGGSNARAQDINRAGVIIGNSETGTNAVHAFVVRDGQMTDLNTLVDAASLGGATLVDALSINDDGVIIARALSLNPFSEHRVLLTPVAPPPIDKAVFNFESGTQGWVSNGEPIITVAKSTQEHFAGEGALAIQINDAGFASVTVRGPSTQPGHTVTFRIYLPADARIDWVQPFARSGSQWHGNWKSAGGLQLGAWNTIKVKIPDNAANVAALGLELFVLEPPAGVVYLDSVHYGSDEPQ